MSKEYSHFGGRSVFGIGLLESAALVGSFSSGSSSRKCSCDEDCKCGCLLMMSDEFSSRSSSRRRIRESLYLELDVLNDDLESVSGSGSNFRTSAAAVDRDGASDASTVPFVDKSLVEVVDVDRLEASDPWTCSSETVCSMPVDDSSTIEDLETVATADSDLEESEESKVDKTVPESMPKASSVTSSKKSKSKAKKVRQKTLNEKLHKTELCKMFMKDGKCRFGKGCAFAHGESELKTAPPKHPKYKSIPCKNLKRNGFCPFGDKCVFIH